jgi:UDP-glucose 4-epimerase
VRSAHAGETYVPRAPAARVELLADVMIAGRPIEKVFTGIRPGEKIHEIMVSDEECYRTVARDDYYVIHPMLPELATEPAPPALMAEYSSAAVNADETVLKTLLRPYMEAVKGTASLA